MDTGMAIEWIVKSKAVLDENIQFKIGFGTSTQYVKNLSLHTDLIGNDST